MLWLYVISALSVASAATLTGCGQDGLTEEEALMFADNITSSGDYWVIGSDGIIPEADTSLFPTPFVNPHAIVATSHLFLIPKTPLYVDTPQCLPMGSIGVAVDGIPIYSPWTMEKTDAVVNEVFDACQGHPDSIGTYRFK